jgi:hypothetical protein
LPRTARTVPVTVAAVAVLACLAAFADAHGGGGTDATGDAASGQPDLKAIRYAHLEDMCFVPLFNSSGPDPTGPPGPADLRAELFLDTGPRRAGAEFVVTKRGTGKAQLRRLPGRVKVGRARYGGSAAICARRSRVGLTGSSSFNWRLRYLSAERQKVDAMPDHGYCKHRATSSRSGTTTAPSQPGPSCA